MTAMSVVPCSRDRLDECSVLFDAYRMFYEQPSDVESAREFIKRNFDESKSMILLSIDACDTVAGFVQLYPLFCSISMRPMYYLSDLFVAPSARGHGHARALLEEAAKQAAAQGAQRLSLETAATNVPARRLYERLGYALEQTFVTYVKQLT